MYSIRPCVLVPAVVYCCCGTRTGDLCDSLVHLLGGEQRPDRHVREPRGIWTQLCGCCGDFVGVTDNRVGGGLAVIEKPEFELAPDRFNKLGDARLEGRRRL